VVAARVGPRGAVPLILEGRLRRQGCLPPVRPSRARASRRLASRKEVGRALRFQGLLQATRLRFMSREYRARHRHSAEARMRGSSLTGWAGLTPCFKAVI